MFEYPFIPQKYLSRIFYSLYTLRKQTKRPVLKVHMWNKQINNYKSRDLKINK